MEIELKYLIPEDVRMDEIPESPYVKELKDSREERVMEMNALYFDTENKALGSRDIAFRTRREGESMVATLKWGGEAEDGLHRRHEINAPISDEKYLRHPEGALFKGSEMEETLAELVGDMELKPFLEMKYTRREIRLDKDGTIMMMALDEGEILAGERSTGIRELEIELYSGSEDVLTEVGDRISEEFGLIPSEESKLQKGLKILG